MSSLRYFYMVTNCVFGGLRRSGRGSGTSVWLGMYGRFDMVPVVAKGSVVCSCRHAHAVPDLHRGMVPAHPMLFLPILCQSGTRGHCQTTLRRCEGLMKVSCGTSQHTYSYCNSMKRSCLASSLLRP